ncbi:MAG: hypothetical protein J2P19_16035, partial [Pseudonocardia sp.]|nr:hypothetical protein [Pseudonocardia sp.]
ILAAVFLWPSNSNDATGAGNSSDLTPSNTAPAATGKAAPTKGASGGAKSTPKTTPKAPTSTNHPQSTENEPPSSEDAPSEQPHSTKPSSHQPASGQNKPEGGQNGARGSTQNTPGASAPTYDPGFGGESATPQGTDSSPYTAPSGLGSDTPSDYPTASAAPVPAGQSWGQYGAGSRSMA